MTFREELVKSTIESILSSGEVDTAELLSVPESQKSFVKAVVLFADGIIEEMSITSEVDS